MVEIDRFLPTAVGARIDETGEMIMFEPPSARPPILSLEVPAVRRTLQIRRFPKYGAAEIRSGAEDSWIRVSSIAIRENQFFESVVFQDEDAERVQMEVTHRKLGEVLHGRFQILNLISALSQTMQFDQGLVGFADLRIVVHTRLSELPSANLVLCGGSSSFGCASEDLPQLLARYRFVEQVE